MLQVVLARAASLTAGEGTLVVTFAGVNPGVPSEMAACGEGALADLADMLLLGETWMGRGVGDVERFVVEGLMGGVEGVEVRVIRVRHVLSVRTEELA